jgi:hypothetical protein
VLTDEAIALFAAGEERRRQRKIDSNAVHVLIARR